MKYDADKVEYCPACGTYLEDTEVMADGTVDFYCGHCGSSGDIEIDKPL